MPAGIEIGVKTMSRVTVLDKRKRNLSINTF